MSASIWNSGISIHTDDFQQVFSASVGWALATQMAASEHVVKQQDWNVDFDECKITFGQDAYPIQLIGSEDTQSNTWLWGWANPSELPNEIFSLARGLQQWGVSQGPTEMRQDELTLDNRINGHTLSMIAISLSEVPVCYYRCVHRGGAVFVAISEVPNAVFAPIPVQKFTSIAMQIIGQFDVDHKIMAESFLYSNGTPGAWQDNMLSATFGDGQKVEISFDDLGRISNMQVSAG